MERKKRIGISSSSPLVKTGFSRSSDALLKYLYKKRPDYDIYFLNHGFVDGDPNLSRMPWKNHGALTHEIVNSEQYQKDGNFQRVASYGNLTIEKFVVENKLDVVIAVEDPWATSPEFYIKKDWFQFCKKNFLNWITADSLPILPLIKEWGQCGSNLWTWSSFAEKALKEEDAELYKHVQSVPGTLNINEFKPLDSEERSQLRQRFGIQPNEKIILHLGRNQLRKLFFSNLEALAKFRKQHPEQKLRLLFHCSWAEPHGWPLEATIKELGLSPEDVLTTYFCQACGHWHVQSYKGENQPCPRCNAPNSFITAGVGSTISNTDLSKIYGICDGASSPFTSGGLEYFNVESLLCGLPLLCTPYSCGTDFTDQPFVRSIEGTFTREVGTNFKKFVPNPNSIAHFFRDICTKPAEYWRKIAQEGRQWAIKTFSTDTIGSKVEQFIDSCDFINWDDYHSYKKDYDVKNPHAEVPDIEDNVEWLKVLYKNILKMNVDNQDSGLKGWLASLENGAQRIQIEQSFRKIAAEENAKNNPVDFKTLVDKDRENKRGIFVIKESGGDIFMVTSLFKDFHERYPNYDLYVACEPKFAEILAGNPYVYKTLPYIPLLDSEMWAINAGGKPEDQLFHFYCHPAVQSQKVLNYLGNTNPRTLE